jgi:hypothetical protein
LKDEVLGDEMVVKELEGLFGLTLAEDRDEMETMHSKGLQAVKHQSSLATTGPRRAQETPVLSDELEACMEELKAVKEDNEAQEWLMDEYQGGYDECDLSMVPTELRDAVSRVWRRKPRVVTSGGGRGCVGKTLFPDPRVPVGKTNAAPGPSRYTEAVEVGGVGDPSSAMSKAEKAVSMAGATTPPQLVIMLPITVKINNPNRMPFRLILRE